MFFDLFEIGLHPEALVRNNFSSVGFLVQNVFDSPKSWCFCSCYVCR